MSANQQLAAIGPGAKPAATIDEVVIPMTHALLREAIEQARNLATAAARAQSTRELKQSLDAQGAALDAKHSAELTSQRMLIEEQMLHRVRAARLWAAGAAFAIGVLGTAAIVSSIDAARLSAGANVGMDAMARSRQLNDILDRQSDNGDPPPCDNTGCRTGQRAPGGNVFHSPEPPNARDQPH